MYLFCRLLEGRHHGGSNWGRLGRQGVLPKCNLFAHFASQLAGKGDAHMRVAAEARIAAFASGRTHVA